MTPQPSSVTIYERLGTMAVSSRRVTDELTLPGVIEHRLSADQWTAVDGASSNSLMTFVRPRTLRRWRRDDSIVHESIAVVLTRFVFDHGVDIADLIDHAPVGARSLDSWREESFRQWPIGTRHSGWAQVSGTYLSDGEALFKTETHVVHDRGNVGYLVETSATMRDRDLSSDDRAELLAAITTVNFVD